MNSVNLKASVSFVGDGSTNKFYFGFDYINKQFVKVQVGAESSPLTYLTDYTVDDRSVTLTNTPAVGVAIRVYRETPSDRIVEWADGAFIKASQMTLENLQQLHLIEEAQDYPILNSLSKYPDGVNFNALNHRVINVSDPKDPQDVVTKHYMESVQNGFVQQNTALANTATEAAGKAKDSSELAKKWAMSPASPDGVEDTDSPTGYTQSAKIWAALSKEYAGLSKFKLPIGYYNSIDEMRKSETAIVGRPCVTLGYYEPNDGGGGVYIIRQKKENDVDDGGSIIVLDNENIAELIIEGAVNVKQFGAKGDGVTDDTDSIQRALNHVTDTTFDKLYSNGHFIYKKGGGTVYIPSGTYRITETIVIGQCCRLVGDSSIGLDLYELSKEDFTGTVLIADFTNKKSWILESAIYKKDGSTLGYKEKVNGNDANNGKINLIQGVFIENIALYTQNEVYGGIRLCSTPESILKNVSISGTLVAILLNATWGSHIINCYTKSYLYGVLSVLDVNSCSISGYFNRIVDDKNIMINDDNRFDLENEDTGSGWQESMNYKRTGIYSWYSYSLQLQNVITEHWDVGRLIINTDFSDNEGWVEDHSYAAIAARSSRGKVSNIHITENTALNYVWGDYTNIILENSSINKMVGENKYYTGITHLWTNGGGRRYLGESDNIIYIKDTAVEGALTYTNLDDALRRVSSSRNPNWTIYLDAGKTYEISNTVNLTDRNLTFVKNGVGDNPKIKHHISSDRYLIGYRINTSSTFKLTLSSIDIEVFEDTMPANDTDRGLITVVGNAVNGSLMISNANINMKSWCFMQLVPNVSCVLTCSFTNCTYKGTVPRGGNVYQNKAKLVVIDGDYNNTMDNAVIAGNTKGWDDSIATIL